MLADLLGKQFGGDRKLYEVLGYDKNPTFQSYYARYKRQDLAKRIIDAPVGATWRKPPDIEEDQDGGSLTPFEAEFEILQKRMRFWNRMVRLDTLVGIGRYAVLLIGTRGQKLEDPLLPNSLKGQKDVLYLAPYSEHSAQVQKWETREDRPRFGKPLTYTIQISSGNTVRSKVVHWSRVIHVAEGCIEDEICGTPRLQASYNRLFDHEKVVGGAAEAFWLAVYRGPVFTTQKDFSFDPNEDDAATKSKMEEYIHGLMRTLRVQGMDVNFPQAYNPDPSKTVDALIDSISAATGIPKRILLGSERGELSSAQDEKNWNSRIYERMTGFAEPMILRATIDRLMEAGALPGATYNVCWPNLFELDDVQKADLALKRAQAIAAFSPASPDAVMPAAEFRETELGISAFPDQRFTQEQPEPPEVPIPEEETAPSGESLYDVAI